MKRCECGCEIFGGWARLCFYVHLDGDQERADETEGDTLSDGYEGTFSCLECGTKYAQWSDIPDAEDIPDA